MPGLVGTCRRPCAPGRIDDDAVGRRGDRVVGRSNPGVDQRVVVAVRHVVVVICDLNAFVAVARAGGFREGARASGGSASGLSEAVRRMAEKLGVRLLNRTTRRERPRPPIGKADFEIAMRSHSGDARLRDAVGAQEGAAASAVFDDNEEKP